MASSLKLDTIKSLAGNEAITISESGVPSLNVPAFRAYQNADQNVTSNTETKVQINTKTGNEFFDTHNWFDTSNYRYTPQIAGYYSFSGTIRFAGSSQTVQAIYFYKNGSTYNVGGISRIATSSSIHLNMSDIIYLNGSTDYAELFGLVTATSGTLFDFASPTATSIFSGFLVRGA
jgi:hypothetical protein